MVMGARLKGYLLLGSVFVLGAAAGGSLVYAQVRRDCTELLRGKRLEPRRLAALSHKLDLDPSQEDAVRRVFQSRRAHMREISRGVFERCGSPLREERAKMDREIRAVLREDQRAVYDGLREERHERFGPGDDP